MATFNKFNSFVEDLAEKQHNLQTDQLRLALTNTAPTAGNTTLSNITEISYTNVSSRDLVVASSSQTGGLYSLFINNLTLNATGSVGPFRYLVIFNSANNLLIGWVDRGSSLTLANGESLAVNFDQVNGAIRVQ